MEFMESSILRGPVCVWHPLNAVSVVAEVHDGHSRDLPDPPLEILITGGHDIRLVLGHPVHETVIGVGPLVHAGQPLKPGVLHYPQGYSIFASQFL